MTHLLLLALLAHADEGMWTFDAFPAHKVQEKYGFAPTQAWLDHLRLSSVKLGGCSGSLVSPDGLVLTNDHCVIGCAAQHSTAERDLVKDGWYAPSRDQELRCDRMEARVLTSIQDVTAEVGRAVAGLEGAAFAAAQKAEIARLEAACARGEEVRCSVVNLYHGGAWHLYTYDRYTDLRLVFSPEYNAAFFGGDLDNFDYPRYNLDGAFLRVWTPKGPLKNAHHLAWSGDRVKEGDLLFVAGHPGSTRRLLTQSQLEYDRDVELPEQALLTAETRGLLREYMKRGPEERRTASHPMLGIENSLKSLKGRWATLLEPRYMARKMEEERALRAAVAADPALLAATGGAWDEVARAVEIHRRIRVRYAYLEGGKGFSSELFGHARRLVRWAAESGIPDGQRLPEYTGTNASSIRQSLASRAPFYPELDVARFTFSLVKLREELSPDDPLVRQIFGGKTAEEVARSLVTGSRLSDPEERLRLFDGGPAALEASQDPMILLARLVDPEARAVRKVEDEQVRPVLDHHGERIARAWFATHKDTYPDATGTLRLNWGSVRGWVGNGVAVPPITTFQGMFDRATGADPFALPPRWLAARGRLGPQTPFNFVSDNDIVGGNSGSPVVDRAGRVVGVAFDGNVPSLGGAYLFDDTVNRMVTLSAEALLEALDTVYGARPLADELRKAGGKARKR